MDEYKIFCDEKVANFLIKIIKRYSSPRQLHPNLERGFGKLDHCGLCFSSNTFGYFSKNSLVYLNTREVDIFEFVRNIHKTVKYYENNN